LITVICGFQRSRQRALKQVSVPQIGEAVVLSHVSDLLFGPAPVGNFLVCIDPSTAGQFSSRDGKGSAVQKLGLIGIRSVDE
jgi:hypothetical protein